MNGYLRIIILRRLGRIEITIYDNIKLSDGI
jgi:hypothetical protein